MIVANDKTSRSSPGFVPAPVTEGLSNGDPRSAAPPGEVTLNQRAEIALRLLPDLGVPPLNLALAYQLAGALAEQRSRLNKMVARCRRSISEKSVHNLRVHCRRLIARLLLVQTAVPSLEAASTIRFLKRLMKAFGELRDVQVQQQALRDDLKEHPELAGLWLDLGFREQDLSRAAANELARFKLGKINKRVRRVESDLADPVARLGSKARLQESLVQALESAYTDVARRKQAVNRSVPATVHSTRIAYKKYRYMVESLPAGIGRPSPIQLSVMADYQAAMGRIQDVEVLESFVSDYAQRTPVMAKALQRFRSLLEKRRQDLVERYLDVADTLESFWPLSSPPPSPDESPDRRRPSIESTP